ncbi:alpha/beta hydrolase [Amycolatopsis sp. SID8362]|uniref:alpha/beta fold hydrolase n=1 Tax=Amycolatopsis sp. SID8362 TaxID=2690346 RepID=UPI0019423A5E|nr:alpha/beta hydrolase [Amycolatopsis sp. SID8362]
MATTNGRKRVLAGVCAAVTAGLAVGAVVLSGTASAKGAQADATARTPKPTIVLEHGAFADGSSWNGVISDLREQGYPVVAAANPLRGPASDAASLRTVLDHIKGPKVVVGHSYGGNVISEAAAGDPEVKALVYVAAFLPAPGESALELTNKYPGSTLPGALDPVSYRQGDGTTATDLYIRQDKFRHQFAADVPADQAADMAAAQRPVAQAALEEKATTAAWKTIPSWAIVTTEDLNIPAAAQRFMAQRAHARTTEVAASHSVAVSRPDLVARVIEQAARRHRPLTRRAVSGSARPKPGQGGLKGTFLRCHERKVPFSASDESNVPFSPPRPTRLCRDPAAGSRPRQCSWGRRGRRGRVGRP